MDCQGGSPAKSGGFPLHLLNGTLPNFSLPEWIGQESTNFLSATKMVFPKGFKVQELREGDFCSAKGTSSLAYCGGQVSFLWQLAQPPPPPPRCFGVLFLEKCSAMSTWLNSGSCTGIFGTSQRFSEWHLRPSLCSRFWVFLVQLQPHCAVQPPGSSSAHVP